MTEKDQIIILNSDYGIFMIFLKGLFYEFFRRNKRYGKKKRSFPEDISLSLRSPFELSA